MTDFTLSPRLTAVARFVVPGLPVADIGTDHAYLPIALVQAGAVPSAIATDIGAGPLAAARRSVAEAGLSDAVDIRVGSGLTVLRPGEAGTIVIAGMGGYLIRDIIAAAPHVATASRRLVLQPMRDAATLRRWLWTHGWALAGEALASEGERYYAIIAAERPRAAGHDQTPGAQAACDAAMASRIARAAGIGDALAAQLGPLVIARRDPLLLSLVDRELALTVDLSARIEQSLAAAGRTPGARRRQASLARRQDELLSLRRWLLATAEIS